jgi:IS605 OrfB family transposase
MRPFAQYYATYAARTPIVGESPSSLDTIGLQELHKVKTLEKERHNLLANLVLSAALGGYRDKFNPKRVKQAPAPSKACDIIVIEELSNLKPSLQERTERENKVISSMKASSFKEVLNGGCQRHGIKLVQVRPAETSRIDSRTGSFGVRVEELTAQKFMTQDGISKCVQEARERREKGSPRPGDNLWISTYDRLRGLSRSQLSQAKNVFIPAQEGPLFLSVYQDSFSVINTYLNTSFNLALKAFMDPLWEGSQYKSRL